MPKRTKILILDDSAELLDALTLFLEEHSFEVRTAISEILFKIELERFTPDVIILDVYIKNNVDGRNICRMIKSNSESRDIPIILMSASTELLKNYKECNADAVINKPFDLSVLLTKVRTLAPYDFGSESSKNQDGSVVVPLIYPNSEKEKKYAVKHITLEGLVFNILITATIIYLFFF